MRQYQTVIQNMKPGINRNLRFLISEIVLLTQWRLEAAFFQKRVELITYQGVFCEVSNVTLASGQTTPDSDYK